MRAWTSGQGSCVEPVLVVLSASPAAPWTQTSSLVLCPSHTSCSTLWTRWEVAGPRVKLHSITGSYWLMPHLNAKDVLDRSKNQSLPQCSHQPEDKKRISENNLQKTEQGLLIKGVLGWYLHKAVYCLVKLGVLLSSCKNIIGTSYIGLTEHLPELY